MSKDAIVMLKDDHKEVRKLFREFQKAGDHATPARASIVEQIIELLTVHTYIENEVMYPRVRALLPDLEDDVLESYEEHHVADVLVMELSPMKPDGRAVRAKTTVLIENVTHHIEEEEQDWFPKVREGLGRTQLREIGDGARGREGEAPAPAGAAERPQEDRRRGHRLSRCPDDHTPLSACTQRLEASTVARRAAVLSTPCSAAPLDRWSGE